MMRFSRTFLRAEGTHFHVVSRIVDRQFLLGDKEKAFFHKLMRRLEGAAGVQVLTYCLMDNHVNLLLCTEDIDGESISDGELVTQIGGLFSKAAGHGEGAGSSFGPSPMMRATVADVGSLILDIDRDVLTGTMIDRDAAVRDRFQLVKQGLVTPELIEFPWQPVGPRYLVERFEPGAM